MTTRSFRIPIPEDQRNRAHTVRVRARNVAGIGRPSRAVTARAVDTGRARQVRINDQWFDVGDHALANLLEQSLARTSKTEAETVAEARRVDQLEARVEDDIAEAVEELTARIVRNEGALSVEAERTTQLIAEVAGKAAATAVQMLTTRVTATENVDGTTTLATLSRWLVKTRIGDVVGGVGLLNDGTTTSFVAQADRFAILQSGDSLTGLATPFIVQGGTVYIDNAMIRDGSISHLKAGAAFIENLVAAQGRIQHAWIERGNVFDLSVGNVIASDNFQAGVRGWRVTRDGSAEFDAASIRGEITAARAAIADALSATAISALRISAAQITAGLLDAQRIRLNGQTLSATAAGLFIRDRGVGTPQIAGRAVSDAGSGISCSLRRHSRSDGWVNLITISNLVSGDSNTKTVLEGRVGVGSLDASQPEVIQARVVSGGRTLWSASLTATSTQGEFLIAESSIGTTGTSVVLQVRMSSGRSSSENFTTLNCFLNAIILKR